MEEITKQICSYWSRRAEQFSDAHNRELDLPQTQRYADTLQAHAPMQEGCRCLDVGCGSGFISILLAKLGYEVTGADVSEDMLKHARENLDAQGFANAKLAQMDIHKLEFPDESFDYVATRNVTWIMADPAALYQEIFRVLRPGGRFVNFDANYARGMKTPEGKPMLNQPLASTPAMIEERNRLANSLYIAEEDRPVWDLKVLQEAGFTRFDIDTAFGGKAKGMFMVCAEKPVAAKEETQDEKHD